MLRINIVYRLLIKSFLILIVISFFACNYNISFAQVKAFPGAEGYGTETRGAYELYKQTELSGDLPDILHVTNLNASGAGSFKAAAEASGPRIVVFDVAGLIDQGSTRIFIQNPYLTIAGQTAPGDGICLKNSPLVTHTHDVIIRGIRSRAGDEAGGYAKGDRDGITLDGNYGGEGDNFYNIVIDHCSVSWGIDETVGTWFPQHDVTFSWNIISEGLLEAGHTQHQYHSMGLLVADDMEKVSIHHNYFAHNNQRNPLANVGSTLIDVVNNVVYNFGEFASHNENSRSINYVKNYLKRGLNSTGNTVTGWSSPYDLWGAGVNNTNSVYLEGNIGWNRTIDSQAEDLVTNIGSSYITATRFSTPSITETSATDAVNAVLTGAGAYPRDSVDARVVQDYSDGDGTIIDSQNEVGGWPTYSGTAPMDTDNDGMPDAWESSHGLNPNDLSDAHNDRNGDGYYNIEEYINSFFPAVSSIHPIIDFQLIPNQ